MTSGVSIASFDALSQTLLSTAVWTWCQAYFFHHLFVKFSASAFHLRTFRQTIVLNGTEKKEFNFGSLNSMYSHYRISANRGMFQEKRADIDKMAYEQKLICETFKRSASLSI